MGVEEVSNAWEGVTESLQLATENADEAKKQAALAAYNCKEVIAQLEATQRLLQSIVTPDNEDEVDYL
jgi:hypothetical protein